MEKKFWLVGLVVWFFLRIVLPILILVSSGATLHWARWTSELKSYLRSLEQWPGMIVGDLLVNIGIIAVIGWVSSRIWKRYKKSKGESVRTN